MPFMCPTNPFYFNIIFYSGKEVSGKSSLELLDANSSEKVHDVKVSAGMMIADTIVKMQSLEDAPAMNQNSDPGT